jgi:hypothetical protein
MGNTLKLPSPAKLAQLSHFPPASQVDRLAGLVFYVYLFSGYASKETESIIERQTQSSETETAFHYGG